MTYALLIICVGLIVLAAGVGCLAVVQMRLIKEVAALRDAHASSFDAALAPFAKAAKGRGVK